MPKLAYP